MNRIPPNTIWCLFPSERQCMKGFTHSCVSWKSLISIFQSSTSPYFTLPIITNTLHLISTFASTPPHLHLPPNLHLISILSTLAPQRSTPSSPPVLSPSTFLTLLHHPPHHHYHTSHSLTLSLPLSRTFSASFKRSTVSYTFFFRNDKKILV